MKQIVLRAYQLARAGQCRNFEDIKVRLLTEGFHSVSIEDHLAAPAVQSHLDMLCEEANRGKR